MTVKNRGVILVLLMLVAGLAAAVGAIWHQYRLTRQALEFWGPDVAHLIDRARSVALIDFTIRNRTGEAADLDRRMPGSREIDISQARGLVHFRRSLLEDANFDWDQDRQPAIPVWDYGVRFTDDEASVLLVFDLDLRLISIQTSTTRPAIVTERMGEGLARFFADTLSRDIK